MTQVRSAHSVGGGIHRYVHRPARCQPRSSPPRNSCCSRTYGRRWRCRCQWRGVVWIVTLLGCCVVVADTSSVRGASSRDSEGGRLSAAGLSRGSLLQRPSTSSSDFHVNAYDSSDNDDSEADSRPGRSQRRRWNAATARTSDELSANTARLRHVRRRRTSNSAILLLTSVVRGDVLHSFQPVCLSAAYTVSRMHGPVLTKLGSSALRRD